MKKYLRELEENKVLVETVEEGKCEEVSDGIYNTDVVLRTKFIVDIKDLWKVIVE